VETFNSSIDIPRFLTAPSHFHPPQLSSSKKIEAKLTLKSRNCLTIDRIKNVYIYFIIIPTYLHIWLENRYWWMNEGMPESHDALSKENTTKKRHSHIYLNAYFDKENRKGSINWFATDSPHMVCDVLLPTFVFGWFCSKAVYLSTTLRNSECQCANVQATKIDVFVRRVLYCSEKKNYFWSRC